MSKLKIETLIGEEDITAPVYKIESCPITNPFCKNEKLWFSEESSYRGLLETYNEIKISE